MDIAITLAVTGDNAHKVSCNGEPSFKPEVSAKILEMLRLIMLTGDTTNPVEDKFLAQWLTNRTLPAGPEKTPAQDGQKTKKVDHTTQVKEILRALKGLLKDKPERATLYKICFQAALASERDVDQLGGILTLVRESLDLDQLLYSLISDAVAQTSPGLSYSVKALSSADRHGILALCLFALGADEQKHVLELAACRFIMTVLELTAVSNSQMAAFTGKRGDELVKLMRPEIKPAALLNVLRLVIADKHLQSAEKQLVMTLMDKMNPTTSQGIVKLAGLEYGKRVPL